MFASMPLAWVQIVCAMLLGPTERWSGGRVKIWGVMLDPKEKCSGLTLSVLAVPSGFQKVKDSLKNYMPQLLLLPPPFSGAAKILARLQTPWRGACLPGSPRKDIDDQVASDVIENLRVDSRDCYCLTSIQMIGHVQAETSHASDAVP